MADFNELDWLRSTDAHAMLDYLFPPHCFHSTPEQPRKLRLYYTALARLRAKSLPAVAVSLLQIAESLADGLILEREQFQELYEVVEMVAHSGGPDCRTKVIESELRFRELGYGEITQQPQLPADWENSDRSMSLGWLLLIPFQHLTPAPSQLPRFLHNADLLRDVYGNPFESTLFQAEWRTERVVGLAEQCYESRDFRALPLLADALQEVGAPDDLSMLRHFREEPPNSHCRGCWALDAIVPRGI